METPKNGRVKYKYNEKCGMFELDKTYGFSFPFEFGFVPSKIAEAEIPWMRWLCLMKPHFPDAWFWPTYWAYYKRNSVRENR